MKPANNLDMFLHISACELTKDAGHVAEKKCRACGEIKSIDQFPDKPSGGKVYKRSTCRICSNEKAKIRRRDDEWRKKVTPQREAYRANRKATLGYSGSSPEYKRQQKLNARAKQLGISPEKVLLLRERKRNQAIENCITRLCEQNAAQAWDYWIKTLAPQWWLERYYAVKPWLNPRLTWTEKFRIQYKHDQSFQIRQRIRAHVRRQTKKAKIGDLMRFAINRGGSSKKVEDLLGYTIQELKDHLEKQFTRGMNWDKFKNGSIHIDHIVPISAFDIKEVGDSEWVSCWKLHNLRPLWASDNIKKSNKVQFLL